MADVKVCDRCGKLLSDKRAIISLKAVRYRLGVVVLKELGNYQYGSCIKRERNTDCDLCEDCSEKLVDFLEGKAVEACK